MKITKQMLLDKEACSNQVELFVSLFGEEVKVTKANCLKAWKVGIDFNWAANNLLSPSQLEAYKAIEQPSLKAYGAIERSALKAYKAIEQPALEAYEAIKQPALEAYEAIKQPALKAYEAIKQPAWEA